MRQSSIIALACAMVLGVAALQEVRADPAQDGSIRLSPHRLILGALAYGDPGSTVLMREVKIEGLSGAALGAIDLSHAPGVRVSERQETGGATLLRIGINVAEFTRGEPYGILIKRVVRLETTSPDQPQLLLPVVGWTALNKTSRDFNDYLFAGHERWQGIWATPNIAGSVLAPLLLLILGGAATLFTAKGSGRRWLNLGTSVPLFGLFGALVALLAASYSRGAWVAFLAGGLVLASSSARLRRWASFGLLVFALMVFLLPAGLKRVDSYVQLQEDPSIAHRLKLWIGALQMMGDHPGGVGAGQFSSVLERDYQRFDHVALNSTPVSDYLVVGSERGVFLLSLILGSLLLVLVLSLRAAKARDNPWQLTLSAALVAILVASAFSTLWFDTQYQRLLGLILAGLLICLLVQMRSYGTREFGRLVSLEGLAVGSCLIVLEMMALSSLFLQPSRSSDVLMTDPRGASFSVHWIEPRWRKARGVIVYFPGEQDSLSLLCHSTLRPLAALGWNVCIPNSTSESSLPLVALVAAHHSQEAVFVAGQKEGGRLAWSAVALLSSPVLRGGAGLDFLTPDMDPGRGGAFFRTPFLVFHRLYDDQASADAAIRASRRSAFSSLPLTIRLSSESPTAFSSGTTQWVEAMNDYFIDKIPH